MKISSIVAISVALTFAACGEAPDDGGEPTDESQETGQTFGTTPAGEGKDDDVGARNLIWLSNESEDVSIEDVSHTGTAVVEVATNRDVKWSADRILLHQQPNERVNIAIHPDGWLTDIKQDIAFGLYYSTTGGERWTPVSIPAVIDGQEAEIFIFERIEMDPEREAAEIEAVLATNIGILRESEKIPFEGFADQEIVWGVVPLPIGQWGDLEGDYPYELEADCEGVACTKER